MAVVGGEWWCNSVMAVVEGDWWCNSVMAVVGEDWWCNQLWQSNSTYIPLVNTASILHQSNSTYIPPVNTASIFHQEPSISPVNSTYIPPVKQYLYSTSQHSTYIPSVQQYLYSTSQHSTNILPVQQYQYSTCQTVPIFHQSNSTYIPPVNIAPIFHQSTQYLYSTSQTVPIFQQSTQHLYSTSPTVPIFHQSNSTYIPSVNTAPIFHGSNSTYIPLIQQYLYFISQHSTYIPSVQLYLYSTSQHSTYIPLVQQYLYSTSLHNTYIPLVQQYLYSTSQNSTYIPPVKQYHMAVRWKVCEERGGTWSSVRNPLLHQSTQYHMAVRWKEAGLGLSEEPSVAPVHTVPHGGEMERGGTWSSVRNPLLHQSTQYHMAVRWKEAGLGAQWGTLYCTSPHSTTWRWDGKRRDLELSEEPSIAPVHTVPHGGQMERGGTWSSVRNPLLHQSTQYHMAVRWKEAGLGAQWGTLYCTSPHSTTWRWDGKRRDLELSEEPSIAPVHTVPHGGEMERGGTWSSVRNPLLHQSTQYHMAVRWKEVGSRAHCATFYSTRQHMVVTWKAQGPEHATLC